MTKAGLLLASITLVTLFATTCPSALAQWESLSLEGEAQIKSPLHLNRVIWVGGSGGSIACQALLGAAEGGQAHWTSNALKGATEVTIQTAPSEWTGCIVTAGTTKEEASVLCEHFAIKQPLKGELSTTFSNLVECTIKTTNCVIAFPPQTAKGLNLENSGSNQIA